MKERKLSFLKSMLLFILCTALLFAESDVIRFNLFVQDNPIDFCGLMNVQDTIRITDGTLTASCRVKDVGVTDKPGVSPLIISAELGVNINNNTPNAQGWYWFPVQYSSEDNNGDIYTLTVQIDDLPVSASFYLLSRFALPDSQYVYGAYHFQDAQGGIWDGNDYIAPLVHLINESALDEMLPEEFALHAPYPNPFNPSTTIKWDIAEAGDVKINIYDLSGRLAQTIHSGYQEAGSYKRQINMFHNPSGIYLLHMVTSSYREVKKMLLVK